MFANAAEDEEDEADDDDDDEEEEEEDDDEGGAPTAVSFSGLCAKLACIVLGLYWV